MASLLINSQISLRRLFLLLLLFTSLTFDPTLGRPACNLDEFIRIFREACTRRKRDHQDQGSSIGFKSKEERDPYFGPFDPSEVNYNEAYKEILGFGESSDYSGVRKEFQMEMELFRNKRNKETLKKCCTSGCKSEDMGVFC